MASSSDLDLMLIGKPGSGKSATGNSILQQNDAFKISDNTTSDEKFPQYRMTRFHDRDTQVVECPGVIDIATVEAIKDVVIAILNSVLINPQGYHALLIVVKFGQSVLKEDLRCLQILKIIFGENVIKSHGIIVMCHGDKFNKQYPRGTLTLENFCDTIQGPFKNLLEECNNRIVLFDNITEASTKNKQLDNLITIVDKLETNGKRCTTEWFQRAIMWTKPINEKKARLIEHTKILLKINNTNIGYNKEETINSFETLLKNITKHDELKQNVHDTLDYIKRIADSKELLGAVRPEARKLNDEFKKIKQEVDSKYFIICLFLIEQEDYTYINRRVDKIKSEINFDDSQMSLRAKEWELLSELLSDQQGSYSNHSQRSNGASICSMVSVRSDKLPKAKKLTPTKKAETKSKSSSKESVERPPWKPTTKPKYN